MAKKEVYELTNPQKSIWNMEEYFKGTTINNICGTEIIHEQIDTNILKQAINEVVRKNDSFRIKIHVENGKPMQQVIEYTPFEIEVVHIKNEKQIKQIQDEEINHKFNITASCLYKFKIFILENGFGGFITTLSHIISDSWTMGLVAKAVIQEYHSIKNNEKIEEIPPSYIDYINSEKEYKQSEKHEADKEYWRKTFETLPEIVTIPSNAKISKNLSCSAKRESLVLNTDIVQSIKSFCAANKISIFNFLMAIYSIYIGRVSNIEEFVIGTPILNRANFREKQTMGMFINTLPAKISMPQNIQFTEFTHDMSRNMISLLKHQKYSYNQILEDVRKQNANIPNLYNIMISYQITKTYSKEYGDYTTEWTFNNCCADDMDIHITDLNDTGELIVSYDYLIEKYNINDIQNLHNRIVHMIEQVLNNENILTNEIEIVTEEEKNKILYEFNNTTTDYPKDKTILELFEEQVEKTPNNIAVVFENEKLTYKELNEKANSLANYLIEKGTQKGDVIAILLDKSIETIIAIISILKCGATYMPIDIEYPEKRIDYMLKNSNTKYILTSNNLTSNFSEYTNKICIDLNNSEIYNNNKNILIKSSSEDIAYIMYTSGSTGEPKGVMVCNKNIIRLVKNTNYIQFEDSERILQTGSIVFDACTFEIWAALLNGFELYIIKKQDLLDPNTLEKYLKENKITILWLTAPLFNKLSENNPKMFETVRTLLTGGDVLSPRHINLVRHNCPNLTIINGYGPTENTTFSTCFNINKDYNNSIPIGYPIANSTCYIVSKNLKLMPVNAPGELLVGGDGVSKGYLNNEDTTKEKFIPNIFGAGILYKTGDLVKWRENGSIEFIERIDNQVKIRGFRIEIDEINRRMQEYEAIKECITIVKTINYEKVICSYFSANKQIDIKKLKDFLRQTLPNYAIPTYFIQLDSLPINANGKIDRKKLPELEMTNEKKEIILPRNKIDEKIIEIIKELLKVNQISIDDSFFELGGDSLSAINLCVKIQSEFNTEIYVKDILENPTIEKISNIISEKKQTSKKEKIQKIEKAEYYSASSAQKRIYFASKVAGNDNILYNIAGGVILEGKIDTERLENSLKEVIKRNEALRTHFEVQNEELVQKIEEELEFKLEKKENEKYEELDKLFQKFVKPFDLSKAPLFRAELITFTNGKAVLFIDMHHIISDGTSLGIITEEICKQYNGEKIEEKEITYKDYAAYEKEKIEKGKLKEAEEYWLHQFEGEIPVLNMRTREQRPTVQNFEGKRIHTKIDKKTTEKISQIAKELNITPYMLLLTAYYILLSKYTSEEDIVVGSPIIARDMEETYNVIGMFVNTLALREKIKETETIKETLMKVKENVLNAYKYQTYPFDELVNKLGIKRDTSRNPLFDIMFIYQNNGYKELNFNGINAEYYIPDSDTSKFDISLEVIPSKEEISLSFEYATKLFEEEFIKEMSNHYINIVKTIIENIDTKIIDMNMLSEDEKNKILYEFNNTTTDYPKDKTIAELFEEQAEKTPNNIAVIFEDKTITYKELNEKANSLANYLREKEVKRNELVGIMVKRSIEMIVAMLGVLKAGGAYIPIDPTYPKDRIEYMLSSSNAKILLTQKQLENKIEFKNKIYIDLNNEEIYNYTKENLSKINKAEDLCYVIFTSGSTGKPKGVMLTHKNIINFTNYCNNYVEYLKEPENKTIVSITTISFDIFLYETIISLQKGIKVVITNENEQTTPQLLNNLMEKYNVNITQATPSIMQIFINNIENMPALKKLKYVTLAGEQLPLSLVKKLHELNIVVYNGYGPSETYYATLYKMDDKLVTIGKPMYNTQIYILDKNLNPLPIGVVGEIYISGDGVGKGYLNNKELTNKTYITNPFIENSIMYKTGDMGMYLNSGEIVCLGRGDHQVKIRGLRIELEEIEARILEFPHIKKTAVIKQTIQNREFISAYFVADKRVSINEIRKYLSKLVPRYMVPSYFIPLDDLPYTPNGKVDRKALPLPTEGLNKEKEEYIPPKTEIQRKLVNIWEKVLNIKPIGINDNFFELGGDSLLAMNLNVELIKISNKITYSDIFRFPTIIEQEEKINSNTDKPMFGKVENLSDSYIDILKNCTKKEKIVEWHPKGVLLTGSTGFLGIHILEEFIKNEKTNIYCIIREEPGIKAKTKLKQKLNYYFGNKYDNLIDKRIFAIVGSITKPDFGLEKNELFNLANSVDIVINSAALVTHYGDYINFYNTNVKSVKYAIDFCKNYNKKLYHISTTGVAGTELDSSLLLAKQKNNIIFDESTLYIGQLLGNVYTRSKFEAENYVLNAVSSGLNGYILRMGNLMPRYSDGVFQENILDNAFVNKIAAFTKIKIIPKYMLKEELEFTPVDSAANGIYKLITHPTNQNRIFHLYNHKTITIEKYVKMLKKWNYKIDILEETEFKEKIKTILENDEYDNALGNLIYEFDENLHMNFEQEAKMKSSFTIKYLRKIGFKWRRISNKYLNKFINLVKGVI